MRDGNVKFMAAVLMLVSTPVLADTMFKDDFNGGFDQAWAWVTDGDAQAAIGGNGLRLYSPNGYGANSIGGYVATTYGVNSFVSAQVNTSGARTGNDQGVFALLQGENEFYGLNYDPFLNKLQLIYNRRDSFTNLDGATIGEGQHGTLGQAVDLRLQIINYGNEVRLVGQAWSLDGTVLLGSVQEIIDGNTSYEGIVVPVLGAGVSGVYAALNMNEYIESNYTMLSPLNTTMDNFTASGMCSAGDANLDGVVDEADYAILMANMGTGTKWSEGDFNFDDAVDEADFALLASHWSGGGAAPGSVPEPATMSLLGMGAVAMGYRRRK